MLSNHREIARLGMRYKEIKSKHSNLSIIPEKVTQN